MSMFLNIFRFKKKNKFEQNQYHQEDNDSSDYINIDKYNQPDKEKNKLNE